MNDELKNDDQETDAGLHARPLAHWQKVTVAVAVILAVIGVLLYGISYLGAEEEATTPQTSQQANSGQNNMMGSNLTSQSFSPQQNQVGEGAPVSAEGIHLGDWSTLFMKLGFSFLIGFSIGYALSTFLKLTAIVVGVLALFLFGLQYAGVITVDWGSMENIYNNFIAWLQPQIDTFKDFITSNLSSSALAAVGLAVGLSR